MTTEREELHGTLGNTICNASNYPSGALPYLWGRDMSTVLDRTTDSLLAAGYRKPRTITTLEELDVLPGESVIRDSDAMVFEVDCMMDLPSDKWWITAGMLERIGSKFISLPATVLYEPTSGGAA